MTHEVVVECAITGVLSVRGQVAGNDCSFERV